LNNLGQLPDFLLLARNVKDGPPTDGFYLVKPPAFRKYFSYLFKLYHIFSKKKREETRSSLCCEFVI